MRQGTMNKLAMADCHNCGGTGKIKVPNQPGGTPAFGRALSPSEKLTLPVAGFGFTWAGCSACGGSGKR